LIPAFLEKLFSLDKSGFNYYHEHNCLLFLEGSMKKVFSIIVLVLLATSAHAKIYKWVDENGSVHFSDKPYSRDAEEVKVQGTGISVQKSDAVLRAEKAREAERKKELLRQKEAAKAKSEPVKNKPKVITEEDYRISSSVGKLGADIISISGRISSGPRCKDMSVTATATNDNGLSATITDNVSKTNSFGSTIYEGNAKVSGSAEDYGFWEVDSVTIRCDD
jgi:hypothetical protein